MPRVLALRHLTRRDLPPLILLGVGVIALLVAAPTFLLFIPPVAAAWLLARMGWMPEWLHARHETVKLVGGPSLGSCAFVEVSITAHRARSPRAIGMLSELVERAQKQAEATDLELVVDTEPIARAPGPFGEHDRELMTQVLGGGRRGSSKAMRMSWRAEGSSPQPWAPEAEAKHWTGAWPDLVRQHRERGARLSLEMNADIGRTSTHDACLLGSPDDLAEIATGFTRWLRSERRVEAWTTGWLRQAERAAYHPRRKPRATGS